MFYSSGPSNIFNDFIDRLSVPLIACNAFAMCSDVMPSLIFVGITGHISTLLLVSVCLMWLILYLYGASGGNDKYSFERDYYINKLTKKTTPSDEIMIKSWVMFNDFRIKLYKHFRHNPKENIDSNIIKAIKDKLISKYSKEKEDQKNMVVQWIDSFYDTFSIKADSSEKYFSTRFLLNEGEINKLIGSKGNKKLISIFAAREASLISGRYMVRLFSSIAVANIVINALTMFGSAPGVMKVIATYFSISISPFALNLMAVLFLLAGAWSSCKLTWPMINKFGLKLDAFIDDLNFSKGNFSNYTRLAAVMAFFTAIGSATFAVYNTPIIAMLPPALLGLSFLVRYITFAIVLVSSFSLYFISVSTKLGYWGERSELEFNINAVDYKNIFIGLAFIGLSVLADVVYLPIAYHGCIEIMTLFGLGYMNYGEKGILMLVSSLASFAFCLTSYHQLCALFAPALIYNVFIAIEIVFQFFTIAITFYFGSSKLLEVSRDVSESAVINSLTAPVTGLEVINVVSEPEPTVRYNAEVAAKAEARKSVSELVSAVENNAEVAAKAEARKSVSELVSELVSAVENNAEVA
ncbi:MAG: hypothetical protein HON55_03425, partial [Legionellales bacterium]|nr:hypothetical protein [Legionellales bacterium]